MAAGALERGEPGEPKAGRRALYFCGSIRGGREDQAVYARIVSRLRRFGTVLTEHVAAAEPDTRGEATGTRAGRGPGPSRPACPRTGSQALIACVRGHLRVPALSPRSVTIFIFGSLLAELSAAFSGGVYGEGQNGRGGAASVPTPSVGIFNST